MKKLSLILPLVGVLFLAACGEITMLKEETYSVETIKFKENTFSEVSKVIVNTDKESLVVELRNTRFVKTNEPDTTIQAQWLNDPIEKGEFISSTIYVSESDIQQISRDYTDKFEETMPFEAGEK